MERLLTNCGQDGVIRRIEDSLSSEDRENLLLQLRSLKTLLSGLAKSLCLEAHPLDMRRVLDAEISTLWVLFENCRPTRMKGYGQEFTAEARATLEGSLDKLLEQVRIMRTQVE
jgi:hypothetical protein